MKKQKVEFRTRDNEVLVMIKELIGEAVKVFVEGLPGVEDKMSYKVFNLSTLKESELLDAYLDIVMTEFAIQIDEKAPKEGFTYNTSFDEEGFVWLHATKGVDEEPALVEASGLGHLPQSNHIVYDA